MSKTPYEIRLDVVKLAQDMLNRKMDVENSNFNIAVKELKSSSAGSTANYIKEHSPKMYSSIDLIEQATALYSFVEDNRRK